MGFSFPSVLIYRFFLVFDLRRHLQTLSVIFNNLYGHAGHTDCYVSMYQVFLLLAVVVYELTSCHISAAFSKCLVVAWCATMQQLRPQSHRTRGHGRVGRVRHSVLRTNVPGQKDQDVIAIVLGSVDHRVGVFCW